MTMHTSAEAADATGVNARRVLRLIAAGIISAERSTGGVCGPRGHAWMIPDTELAKITAWRAQQIANPPTTSRDRPGRIADGGLDWQEQAVCAQTDPDLFFPGKGKPTRAPRQVCAGCAVRVQCLKYALSVQDTKGIWGGTTERQRTKIRASGLDTTGEVAA